MTSRSKILIVDDTPKNVKLLADLLEVKGYTTFTATCGKDALEHIANDPPDLILLDVMMPGMSGGSTRSCSEKAPSRSR